MRTDVPIQVDPNQLIIYPGYTFCPTDEDVLYYLKQKTYGIPLPIDFILDQNVYEVPPWQLRSMLLLLLLFIINKYDNLGEIDSFLSRFSVSRW
ncbi:NAC domain-containing protein [Dioscorea alata]|uniref:NAC domain-containing protein n=1 Tax=Dioscorea alata TaxID=55571 RepID=A0ACB7UAJ9_DIOAL|nr:NAC domain-containing protein [Dioscorea alata]